MTLKDLSFQEILNLIQYFRYTRQEGGVNKYGETGLYEAATAEARVRFGEFQEYQEAVEAAVVRQTKHIRESN